MAAMGESVVVFFLHIMLTIQLCVCTWDIYCPCKCGGLREPHVCSYAFCSLHLSMVIKKGKSRFFSGDFTMNFAENFHFTGHVNSSYLW